jgi:hypothetical protein
MRYLPSFFGNWDLAVVPTLNNMIFEWVNTVSLSNLLTENYNKHANQEWWSYGATPVAPETRQQQVQFVVQDYEMTSIFFHATQWNFFDSIYRGLLADYNARPFRFSFNRAIPTKTPYAWSDGSMTPARQTANRIDSVFITFHTSQHDKASPKQPFMEGLALICEGAGSQQKYPSSGTQLDTFDNNLQFRWFLDAFNTQNNIFATPSLEFNTSMLPFTKKYGVTVANGFGKSVLNNHSMRRGSISDFILAIPLAPDGTLNEGLSRISGDISWLLQRSDHLSTVPSFDGSSATPTIPNPNYNVVSVTFTSVCDWMCEIMATPSPVPGQARVTQNILNM